MGKEIVYCARCQNRLVANDFERAKAVWYAEKPYCNDCVMQLVAALGPAEEQRILEQLAHKRAGHDVTPPPLPVASSPRKTSTARIPIVRPDTARTLASGGSKTAPVVIAVVALGLIGLLALVFSDSPAPREKREGPATPLVVIPPPAPPKIDPPPVPPSARLEAAARKALDKARDYGKAHAEDLPGRIALLEEAAWECRGTPFAETARKEHEALQKERDAFIAAQLAAVAAAALNSRPGDAFALLEKERGRLPGADWTSAVDQNILQLRQRVDRDYAAARDQALRARRSGAEDEVRALETKVASWGLADLVANLRADLKAVPVPPPALSPEARAFLAAREKAYALARARDYAAALQELEAAAKPLAAADVALVKLAAAAYADVLQSLAHWPKGQKMAVELEGGGKVEGLLTRSALPLLELKTESGAIQVDVDDLSAACLRDLLAKLPGRKPEQGALFLLFEGDPSGATGLPADSVPESLLAWAARADVPAHEAEARAGFEAAEREYADAAAKLGSFDRYRVLLASHGETTFVRRKRTAIALRLETEKDAGKEYFYFADQMGAGGMFRRSTHAKAAVCWTLAVDSPQEKDNFVEFTFAARPETEYRCWVYVGACCAETFAFSAQAGAEPVPVKNTITFLKKTHALHGGRKEPARFEWIQVPLPKDATGGLKTVRLLSGQQGFTVGFALVSSTRPAPPADTVVKEWERTRPAPSASAPPDSGLLAHWTMDEGTGTTAGDSTPNHFVGTLYNDPVWTAGKRRGALSFDGRDDYVGVPKTPRLYIAGPFTVAAWVNVAELPQSKFGMYVVSDYSTDGARCSFSLRVLPSGQAQFFWQQEDINTMHATSGAKLAPGVWVHLAGVWDGAVRTIYVNGVPEGSNNTPHPRVDIHGMVSIGRPGSFNGLYFKGRIDDVRLYERALSAAELQKLAK